tara:strand:+ start:5140 stop:6258 length:1119 start_codon:yes stop_codon:yes gene_type:complete
MVIVATPTFFSPLPTFNNRSIQVLISDGTDMSEEIPEEPMVDSEEEEVPELTIEDHQDALKKSRWNVFMYLGLAVVLFGFALFPFMSLTLSVDEGIGSIDKTVDVLGLSPGGEDITDIPVEMEIIVQSLPTDVKSIEVFMIKNTEGCDATDGSVEKTRYLLQQGDSEHPNSYLLINDPVESQTYDVEFSVDPGKYCIMILVDTQGSNIEGINVESQVDIYPAQFPLATIGVICLLLSAFAFIGAQKHGKFVKALIEPKSEISVEDAVLAQTTTTRITAGPSGPPSGPTGPPSAGPSGPPSAGPSGPPEAASPVVQEVTETPAVVEEPVEAVGDIYEDQGDGWFFRKLPDGSYDQTVYVVEEGQYVPYVDPEA